MQLFVVDKLDKKSGTVAAIYVFDNHDAALVTKATTPIRKKSTHV
jgi:hypothetical protein